MINLKSSKNGFTIVELLIVIVVIAILAALVIVTYNGTQQRAMVATLQDDLRKAAQQLEMDKQTRSDNSYPPSEAEANNGEGLPKSDGTEYAYTVSGDGSARTYSLTATSSKKDDLQYHVTSEDKSIAEGVSPDQVAADPEVGWNEARTIWIDPSSGITIASVYSSGQGFHVPGNLPYLEDGTTLSTGYIESSPYDCDASSIYGGGGWSYAGSGISHALHTFTLAEQCPDGGEMIMSIRDNATGVVKPVIRYYTQAQP